MRGEYRLVAAEKAVTQGSPPLARGILLNLRLRRSIRRITPACAGNTISKDFPQCLIQDHPRLRGEYCYLRRWRQGRQGSPPLARGIPTLYVSYHVDMGITPACAGNTLPSSNFHQIIKGSPPLARGIPGRRGLIRQGRWITPACAGNTLYRRIQSAHT